MHSEEILRAVGLDSPMGHTFVVALVAAIAGKVCDAGWQAMRNLIRCQAKRIRKTRERVRIADPHGEAVLVYVQPLPGEVGVKLLALKPRKTANRVVTWDERLAEWVIGRKR